MHKDAIQSLKELGFSDTVIERFFSKIKIGPNCWEWSGAKFVTGYGKIEKGRSPYGGYYAHRVSWIIHNGPIPAGMNVCHTCDNPKCCNPKHLWLGDTSKNMIDKVKKGRGRWHTRLSREQVSQIRTLADKHTNSEIAAMFKVGQPHISRVINFKRWKRFEHWVK